MFKHDSPSDVSICNWIVLDQLCIDTSVSFITKLTMTKYWIIVLDYVHDLKNVAVSICTLFWSELISVFLLPIVPYIFLGPYLISSYFIFIFCKNRYLRQNEIFRTHKFWIWAPKAYFQDTCSPLIARRKHHHHAFGADGDVCCAPWCLFNKSNNSGSDLPSSNPSFEGPELLVISTIAFKIRIAAATSRLITKRLALVSSSFILTAIGLTSARRA